MKRNEEHREFQRIRHSRNERTSAYDVVVVGARVAGASTAMLLARAGFDVLLVDRAPRPGTDTLSTHALMRGGVLQLARWGLLERLGAAGTPPIRRTTVHYGDQAELIEIKPRGPVDALYAPRRTVLDPLLVEAAEAAGAEVRYGVSVGGLLRRDGWVAGVEATDRGGRRLEIPARWVVGADGLSSRVAREVAAPVTWQGGSSGAFLYDHWEGVEVDGYEWFYRPGATAGIIPTDDGATCVWAGAPTARFETELASDLESAYARLLDEAAPEARKRLASARRVGRLRGFPGVPSFLRKPWGAGWMLVGDAGSFRDPISAHGMTDALRDAELAAGALTEALVLGPTALEPLASFELARDQISQPLTEITDRIASYDWSVAEVRVLLLSLAKAMAREVELLESLDDGAAEAA